MDKAVADVLAHFPPENQFNKSAKRWLNDEVIQHFMIFKDKNNTKGYCTHCHRFVDAGHTVHNQDIHCPECSQSVSVKHTWRFGSSLFRKQYFMTYQKSRKDPKAFIGRWCCVERDNWIPGYTLPDNRPKPGYIDTGSKITVLGLYLFKMGGCKLLTKTYRYIWNENGFKRVADGWRVRKSVFPLAPADCVLYTKQPTAFDLGNLDRAIVTTPFKYSCHRMFYEYDFGAGQGYIRWLALYSKYPSIEYLAKLGFTNILAEKIYREPQSRAINYSGGNIKEVLGFKPTKDEIEQFRDEAPNMTGQGLKIWKTFKKEGIDTELAWSFNYDYNCIWKALAIFPSLPILIKYFTQQMRKFKTGPLPYVCRDWMDYINDCKTLEADIADEKNLFPPCLAKAHGRVRERIKRKANAEFNKKIEQQAKKLNRLRFAADGFLIKPIENIEELIHEGDSLHHCVGSYAQEYANGKSLIFAVRQEAAPSEPFYTVELSIERRKKTLIQIRGDKNKEPDEAVNNFIGEYKKKFKIA